MNGSKKAILFASTVILALATAWWLMPVFVNFWPEKARETASFSGVYGLGLFLGIILGVCWSALIWYWNGKD